MCEIFIAFIFLCPGGLEFGSWTGVIFEGQFARHSNFDFYHKHYLMNPKARNAVMDFTSIVLFL